jgi:hypothetical protein
MNGQMKLSKQEIIDEYVKKVEIYEKPKPIKFDLRAYSAYILKNNLKVSDITSDILQKFVLD